MANTSAAELRTIALAQFATVGFAGASLQHIADSAGLSKSSVLYHYSSKEALLEAAVTPAVEKLERVVAELPSASTAAPDRERFVADFVDFLLVHRLEMHTFINQGQSLRGIPVIERANALVSQVAVRLCDNLPSTEDRIRVGIALGGAAYVLVAGLNWSEIEAPQEETRAALAAIVSELLAGLAR